ncbi:MAG: SIMPL domain-containing protein [Terracidiphilus sp.]
MTHSIVQGVKGAVPMKVVGTIAAAAVIWGSLASGAQQTSQIELKIDANNRTLTVSAEERVTAEPEIAILHIGFQTLPMDAKSAYAAGAKTSNEIVGALKQAGVAETAIRSESQRLDSWEGKTHKFRLTQSWVVKVDPVRVAEILDVAVTAGANDSGQIEWTVNDPKALEDQALEKATARARSDAAALAKGMGVKLGPLVYVTNQMSHMPQETRNFAALASLGLGVSSALPDAHLAIEPHKVSRTATVYAVFAIE